jgi:hypothetical protein
MKIKYILIATSIFSLSAISCVQDSDLEQHDPNTTTEANFWKTDENALEGCKRSLSSIII